MVAVISAKERHARRVVDGRPMRFSAGNGRRVPVRQGKETTTAGSTDSQRETYREFLQGRVRGSKRIAGCYRVQYSVFGTSQEGKQRLGGGGDSPTGAYR